MADEKNNWGGPINPTSPTNWSTPVGTSSAVNQPVSSGVGGYGGGYGYGGGGGYGSGGGGGVSTGPTEEQKEAAGNLAAITNYNMGTLTGKAENADKAFDVSDEQNKNLQQFQLDNAKKTAGNDWYTQQQKLQGVLSQQRDVMGNSYYGSGMIDLLEDMARADDMSDVQTLNQLRENMDSIDSDYYQSIMATNNSRNELYLDTESDLRQLFSDYVAQLNNISADFVNGEEDDFPKLIDAKGRKLKVPSWFDADYFDEHFKQAVTPEYRGNIRPDQAALTAWRKALAPGRTNYSSSANQSYFQRMLGGYNRRTQ